MRIRSRAPQNELRAAQNSLRAARNRLRAARNIPHRRTEYSVRLCGIFRSPVREYSVRLNLNMTKTLAFLIKKVNFAFFERISSMPHRGNDPGSLRMQGEAVNHSPIVDLLKLILFSFYLMHRPLASCAAARSTLRQLRSSPESPPKYAPSQ